ncbi:MAG: N-acetylmuramoyl-L-alanine amidase [Candidatus Muirbacterium halophilum]|nr:N-acetylmuramoyl-L-alanine amidase [Candidatus Muirbacterium halophilum]MCK9474393.1 N-acetylmuramoyl-L-alanine amidase [Candidatus Muirbacterium halophilum]
MAKKKSLLLIFILFLFCNLYAYNSIQVNINSEKIQGQIENDIVYLPLEDVCRKFDIKFGYFPDTGIIAINYNNNMMSTVVDQKELLINSNYKELEIAPRLINRKVYFDVKFFQKYFGFEITWKPEEFDKLAKISNIIIRETGEELNIFVVGDKTYSKNEYMISKNRNILNITFPETQTNVMTEDIPFSDFIISNIIMTENNITVLRIEFNEEYDIQTGPSMQPTGLLIKVVTGLDKNEVLPENRVDSEIEKNINLTKITTEIKIKTNDSNLKESVYEPEIFELDIDTFENQLYSSDEIFVDESLLEKVEDTLLDQNTLAFDTNENYLEDHVIVIDPGHGGNDYGITRYGIYEKDITLEISRKIYDILKGKLARPFITRTGNSNVSSEDRIYTANGNKAELFISIHAGASSQVNSRGFYIYYYANSKYENEKKLINEKLNNEDNTQRVLMELRQMSIVESSRKFARILSRIISDNMHWTEKGTFPAEIRVLSEINCPGIVFEVESLTNRESAEFLKDSIVQQKIAENIVSSIEIFFKSGDNQ